MIFSHEDDAPHRARPRPRLARAARAARRRARARDRRRARRVRARLRARATRTGRSSRSSSGAAFAEAVRAKAEQRGLGNLVVIHGDAPAPRAAALPAGIARRDPRPLPRSVVEAATPPAAARGRPDVAAAAAAAPPGRAPRLPHRRRAVRGRGRRAARGDRVRERGRAGRLRGRPARRDPVHAGEALPRDRPARVEAPHAPPRSVPVAGGRASERARGYTPRMPRLAAVPLLALLLATAGCRRTAGPAETYRAFAAAARSRATRPTGSGPCSPRARARRSTPRAKELAAHAPAGVVAASGKELVLGNLAVRRRAAPVGGRAPRVARRGGRRGRGGGRGGRAGGVARARGRRVARRAPL